MTDHASQQIPGNARKWQVLRLLASSPAGLTTADIAHIYGATPEDALDHRNGTRWQAACSHAAADLRALRVKGLARPAGRAAPPPRSRPMIWSITPAGQAHFGVLERQRQAREDIAGQRQFTAAERRKRRARVSMLLARARRQIAQEIMSTDPAARQVHAAMLRNEGATLAQIGEVYGVTGECIRRDLAGLRDKERTHDDGEQGTTGAGAS